MTVRSEKNKLILPASAAGYIIYSGIFLVMIFAGYGIVYATGHTLIGKNDDVGQYYETFIYIGRYLRGLFSGGGAPLYDLSIGMGEDVAGCLNYYGFGDPFTLISVFANGANAHVLFDLLYFLRMYLAGMAFMLYCSSFRIKPVCAAICAQGYLFAAFGLSAVGKIPAWGCVLIFLPLMLTGCERIFSGQKKGGRILIFAALYAGLCGFYLVYMAGVFLAVYCFLRLCFIRGAKSIRENILTCLHCALYVLAGLLISAPFLFPAVEAFLSSERSGGGILSVILDWHNYIPSLKFIRETFSWPISGNVYFQGMPLAELFCAVLALVMAARGRGGRMIRQCALAVGVIALTFSLPITGYIFNGFSESYTRWAFFVHFVFAVCAAAVLTELWSIRRAAALFLAVTIPLNVVVNCVAFFLPAGGNRLAKLIEKDRIAICVDSPVIHSSAVMGDGGLFRVSARHYSAANEKPENAAMIYGYNSLTYWFSMVNQNTMDGLNAMRDMNENWRSSGLSGDGTLETMAGVKYCLTKDEDVPDYYELRETFMWNGEKWRVYENRRFFGLTYLRPMEYHNEDLLDSSEYHSRYERLYNDEIAVYGGYEGIFDSDRYGVRISARSDDMEAVIAIPYSRNFRAFLDGMEVQTLRSDGIYTSVHIPKEGDHELILEYHSASAGAGVIISVIVLALLLAAGIFRRIRRRLT